MVQVNSDPYAGGHLFVLVNRVTCLFDTEQEAQVAVRALEAEGVSTEDIDVFIGEEGARRLDLSGRDHGAAVRILRSIEDVVTDASHTHHRIDEALRGGAALLCVKLHKRPLVSRDEEGHIHVALFGRDREEKERALRVLKGIHAPDIHYWGAWAVEDVPST